MSEQILLVEDEPDIQEVVRYNLVQAGFEVLPVADGESALDAVRRDLPALVVLDLMLPGIDGLEVCRILKRDPQTRGVPILILSARVSEVDRIVGLELGAEDYIVKPFSPRELVLRVRVILRRASGGEAVDREVETLHVGPLTIDRAAHAVFLDDSPLSLTATEFRLLAVLAERRGRVQTREELLNTVWNYGCGEYERVVDSHVRRLRGKLGRASVLVETVRGVGYRFSKGE